MNECLAGRGGVAAACVVIAISAGSLGCNPGGGVPDLDADVHDVGATDAHAASDAGVDAHRVDAAMPTDAHADDAGLDAGRDAGTDAGNDAGSDAGSSCSSPADCPATGNECVVATCTGHVCGTSFVASGTATSTQTAGDCHQRRCDGAGNVTVAVDDTDVPTSTNPCTTATCTNGTSSFSPRLRGTSCNGTSFCDGAGACVECLQSSDCGASSICAAHTCASAGTCSTSYAASGTVEANPTAGDCHSDQCNGTGGITTNAIDDTDVPADDGNPCTSETCLAGTPHPPLARFAPCPGGACDGSGACVPSPVSPVFTQPPPTNTTAGTSYAVSVAMRSGMTHQWSVINGSVAGPATGDSVVLAAGPANPDGSPAPLSITVMEVNALGQSASATANSTVFAAPTAPTIVLTSPEMSNTAYTATVLANPYMTYGWTITNGSITSPGGSTGYSSGANDAIDYLTGSPGTLMIYCSEINGAGDFATGNASATIH
jgi:hypothetical protein